MISEKLLEVARCPRCVAEAGQDRMRGHLEVVEGGFVCHTCGLAYGAYSNSGAEAPVVSEGKELPRRGYIDLLPRDAFDQHTKYLEEEFEHELDHEHISIPLLGAGVRNNLLRKMLRPGKKDLALEVGCGDARFCYWNRKRFGTVIGVDAAPLFAQEALEEVNLVRGDGRRLPFAPESFDKIFSLDLLEHLPLDGVAPFFAELNRVLKPGGKIFIFSNTREKGKLWPIISLEKRVASFFTKKGVFDFRRDELRKSDHIKAVETWDQLVNFIEAAGFRVEQKIFWNGVFQGLVDNIIIKAGEFAVRSAVRLQLNRHRNETKKKEDQANRDVRSRLTSATTGLTSDWADGGGMDRMKAEIESNRVTRQAEKVAAEAEEVHEENAAIDLAVRKNLKRSFARSKSGPVVLGLQTMTLLMKLDIWLFGKMQTGPYFIVITKK
ncbi:MAG TPA: methyltransferase domain-containing protein [Chloroflexia bacterium]|nr:methyltransferase domain-containing protein [Chloroflexia bacterium]